MGANISDTYTIDASFLLAYLFPDENIQRVQNFFERYKHQKIHLIAPLILPFEVFNGLQAGTLTKRVNPQIVKDLGQNFLQLPIKLEEVDYLEVLSLARSEKLTFYDASYLYLAKKYHTQLLTLDKQLQKLA